MQDTRFCAELTPDLDWLLPRRRDVVRLIGPIVLVSRGPAVLVNLGEGRTSGILVPTETDAQAQNSSSAGENHGVEQGLIVWVQLP